MRAVDNRALLETGSARRVVAHHPAPAEIKIVSYNIRWRGGQDLQEIIALLKSDPEIGGASIIGLQEVDRNKKRTGNTNTVRLMAEALGMHYAWAAPPLSERTKETEEETGVAILSPYPLSEVERIVLPIEGPGGRRRVALGATVRIGEKHVRAYSVHAETRISSRKRVEQFQAVLDDLSRYTKTTRAVVLGDFNTAWTQDVEDATRLFTQAQFETPIPNNKTTWRTFILELKLDWIWIKGLQATEYGIDKKIGYSDHWPLWVKARLDANTSVQTEFNGRIAKIERTDRAQAVGSGTEQVLGTILIEGDGGPKAKFTKADVTVTAATRILVEDDNATRNASFDALKKGKRVRVRLITPITESTPPRATASEIKVQ